MIHLTDTELANVLHEAQEETRRRTTRLRKPKWRDLGAVITGQEMAKRATLIAAAGGHSLLYVGPPGYGKTMLRALAAALGNAGTFEAWPCPCGYYTDPRQHCRCDPGEITAHRRQCPKADMFVDVPPVPARELESSLTGTTEAEIKARIDDMAVGVKGLSADARLLLRNAVAEMGLSARQYDTALQVAETIARVEHAEIVRACHLMEAINYRYPI